MSGYNYNEWRRGERDNNSQRNRGATTSNYWSDDNFNNYPNYNNFQYSQDFPQQWNPWNIKNQNQYTSKYSRERDSSSSSSSSSRNTSRHPFSSSQSHSKATGNSSSYQWKTPYESRSRHSNEKHFSSHKSQSPTTESRNKYTHHSHDKLPFSSSKSHRSQKSISPPLGSEEARKKTLAQTTDKIKSCLRSFKNEKSEVLENLLSNDVEKKKDESHKSRSQRIPKSSTRELQFTPSDLKIGGVVNTSGNTASISDSGTKESTDTLNKREKVNRTNCSVSATNVVSSEENLHQELRKPSLTQNSSVNLPCSQSRSSSSSSSGDVTNKNDTGENSLSKNSFENSEDSSQNKQRNTVKDLKQRIIQQFLKMSKNNLKDVINNPRSRKFEFAMSHLMKEHRMLLSRELRGLAQSRIRGGQDFEDQNQDEPEFKTQSLLDTDIAINLSHLPQEIIDKLGNFLQLNLLDSAESPDFHPSIPVEDETSVHDIQNIEALQVALLSEENIKTEVKKEIEVSVPIVGEEKGTTSDTIMNDEDTESNFEVQDSIADTGEENFDQIHASAVVYEEGGAAKRANQVSYKFSPYIPLGKGFMNRTGEFGNLFCEFPDFMESSEPEGEAIDEQDKVMDEQDSNNTVQVENVKNIDENSDFKKSDQSFQESSSEEIKQHSISNEIGFIKPSNSDAQLSGCFTAILPNEILSDEAGENSGMVHKSVLEDSSDNNANQHSDLEDTEEHITYSEETEVHRNNKDVNMQETPDVTNFQTSNVNSSIHLENSEENKNDVFKDLEQDYVETNNEDSFTKCLDKDSVGMENKTAFLEENVTNTEDKPEEFHVLSDCSNAETASDFQANSDDNNKCKPEIYVPDKKSKTTNIYINEYESVSGNDDITNTTEYERKTDDKEIVLRNTNNVNVIQEECGDSELNTFERNDETEDTTATETDHLRDNDTEDITVEDLYGDLSDYCNAGDMNNSTVSEIQTDNDTSELSAVTGLPVPGEDKRMDREFTNSPSSPKCSENITSQIDGTINKIDMKMVAAPPEVTLAQMRMTHTEDAHKQMEMTSTENTPMQMEITSNEEEPIQMRATHVENTPMQMEITHSEDAPIQTEDVPMQMETNIPEDTSKEIQINSVEDTPMQAEVPASPAYTTDVEIPPLKVTDAQVKLSCKRSPNSPKCQDEVAEVYHCNIVVKAEKDDDSSEFGVMDEENLTEIENNTAVGRKADENQNVQDIIESSELNADPSYNSIDTATQTEPPEELDSNEIQRLLQLLEKSSQLSPELAKLLNNHFSTKKISEGTVTSKTLANQSVEKSPTMTVLREKSPPFIVQPLGSTLSPRAFIHVPESRGLDVRERPTTSLQSNSYVEGMDSGFGTSVFISNRNKKSYSKRSKISVPPEEQEKRLEDTENHKDEYVNNGIEESNGSVNNSGAPNEEESPINARREDQDSPESHIKHAFFRMLEIDREMQRLMGIKVGLYKKLKLGMDFDSPCLNEGKNVSSKSRILHYPGPSTSKEISSSGTASHNLNGRTFLQSNSNTQQMHINFPRVSSHDIICNSLTGDKTATASTPMVMLPMDFVLNSSSEHSSLQRHKTNERLKTFDTSVVEAVLNTFNLPDNHAKGDEPSATELVNNNTHNKPVPEDNSEQELEGGSSTNKHKRHASPRVLISGRESQQQPEKSSPSKRSTPKKQSQKSKSEMSNEQQTPDRKKEPTTSTEVRIVTRNKSSAPTSQVKNQTSNSNVTNVRRSSRSDLSRGREQKDAKQTDPSDNKENASDKITRSTRQRQNLIKVEEDITPSDSSSITEDKTTRIVRQKQASVRTDDENSSAVEERNVRTTRQKQTLVKSEEDITNCEKNVTEDKKNKRSSAKSKQKSDREFESENSLANSRPKRNVQNKTDLTKNNDQISSPTNISTRNRRETRSRPSREIEQSEDTLEQANNRKTTRLSKRQNSITCEEIDIPEDKFTRKRRIPNKFETSDSCQMEISSLEEQSQTRGRRSSGRTSSDQQESPESSNRKNKKNLKVDVQPLEEMQDSVEENAMLSKKHTKTVTLSGLEESEHFLGSDPVPDVSVEQLPMKNKRHINGAQKRKLEDSEGPPAKILRTDTKPDLLQWNLQDCFVMVKPLTIDHIDETREPESSNKKQTSPEKERLRRLSDSSDDIPLRECQKKSKRKDKKQKVDGCHRVDLPDTSDEILELSCDSQQDPLGGIPDTAHPPELHVETYGSVNSSPLQLPPDLLMQSSSRGQCLLPEIAIQDENSISTADGKDDCDQDSSYSYDTAQENREGTSSRASKHRSSRKHKKDRRTDVRERLTFEAHEGPILDIKTVGRHVLAASEDGNVYCYSLKSGKFKRKYEGHNAAVTCLSVIECSSSNAVGSDTEGTDGEQIAPDLFFTGSLDEHLRLFSFKTGELIHKPISIGNPIQCMDQNWGTLYVGTKRGEVFRYNIKTSSLIDEPITIGKDAVLTLKATKEGPRQVLIVGTRNRPVTVRDASTGLLLRSISNVLSNTVYSLVLSPSVVYCGTKTGVIPAVEFTSGEEICRFQAGTGVVCMRIYNNLLFAGSYDGNIYVFSIPDKKQVSCIPGPGRMLLCMDIVKNRIIAGSKDNNKLESWGFPQEIRNHLKEAKHR